MACLTWLPQSCYICNSRSSSRLGFAAACTNDYWQHIWDQPNYTSCYCLTWSCIYSCHFVTSSINSGQYQTPLTISFSKTCKDHSVMVEITYYDSSGQAAYNWVLRRGVACSISGCALGTVNPNISICPNLCSSHLRGETI